MFANHHADRAQGVRVVWYEEGARMPFDGRTGRLNEISAFLVGKDKYAVDFDDVRRVNVTSKTHAAARA